MMGTEFKMRDLASLFGKQPAKNPLHIIISFIIKTNMFVLDSILLLLIVIGLHAVKFSYPNFLFFCKGAILFLPPEEEVGKKKTKQVDAEIKILQVEYKHVKEYPMSDQYDRVIFLLAALTIYIPIRWIISHSFQAIFGFETLTAPSTFTFLVCLVIFGYTLKLGMHIFWISSYSRKYSFLVCFTLNLIFYLIAVGMEDSESEIGELCLDLKKHFSLVFGISASNIDISPKLVLAIVLILNVVMILVSIPSVIKMGNWYTKTLKEVYYEDDQFENITDPEIKKQKEAKQQILKTKSAATVRLLNFYLVAVLAFLFLSHSYSHQFIIPILCDVIRALLMGFMVFVNAYTLKDAIEFNGSFAYRFLSEYLNTDDQQRKVQLRNKITPFIYLIWYHKFQFMFRVIIPLILFLVLVDTRYGYTDAPSSIPLISESHCGISTDQIGILQNLYKCQSGIITNIIHEKSQGFSNGMIIAPKFASGLDETKGRIAKYGILNLNFVTESVELMLWYFNVSLYTLTVVYILFLRKTVYDI